MYLGTDVRPKRKLRTLHGFRPSVQPKLPRVLLPCHRETGTKPDAVRQIVTDNQALQ